MLYMSIQRFHDNYVQYKISRSDQRMTVLRFLLSFCPILWFVYVFLSVFLYTCKYHCSDLWSLKDFLSELMAVVVSVELLFALRGPLTHVGNRPDTYILPVGKVRSLFNMKVHGLHWCLGCICYPSRSSPLFKSLRMFERKFTFVSMLNPWVFFSFMRNMLQMWY